MCYIIHSLQQQPLPGRSEIRVKRQQQGFTVLSVTYKQGELMQTDATKYWERWMQNTHPFIVSGEVNPGQLTV